MKKQLIIFIIIIFPVFRSQSQDAHLSLYDAAPIFLNPAMTGVFDGDWRIHGQFRTQWKAINFKPYTSALISFDKPYKKWGFGGQISNFRAGIGNYGVLQGVLSAAYTTSLDKSKNHNISFGIQGGINQKSVEYQLLTFNNQYTTNNGGEFNTSINANEDFSGQSLITPVVNAGFLYFFAKQESRFNPFLGISAFNLTQPQESFLNFDNRLPIRYYAHTGVRINVTETFYVLPKVLYMRQQEFQELTLAADIGYFLKGSEIYLLAGGIYRNRDAAILSVGARMDNYIARIGYDINVSSLTTVSNGRGGFEISFTYMGLKNRKLTDKICPRL
ncbi:MAG: PorP/SprF family type IX secretion system membrane protein [Brumimicrobium sp.]|nr:PorP/SprF family type IX secretion system membrane protein [Brumimicrobium sp.]